VSSETKSTIDSASIAYKEQGTIAVAVHQAFAHQVASIPDRVGGLIGEEVLLTLGGDVLRSDGVGPRILCMGKGSVEAGYPNGQSARRSSAQGRLLRMFWQVYGLFHYFLCGLPQRAL
jgi:hypothetical protein